MVFTCLMARPAGDPRGVRWGPAATLPAPTASSTALPSATALPATATARGANPDPRPNPGGGGDAAGAGDRYPAPSPTPDLRLSAARWQEWPVIPALSPRARQVLRDGLAARRQPARLRQGRRLRDPDRLVPGRF